MITQGELKEGRLRLDLMQKFFVQRVVRYWSRLPRKVNYASFLEVFKVKLHRAFSNMIQ